MSYDSMNQEFSKDIFSFENNLKNFVKRRRFLYGLVGVFSGAIVGFLMPIYIIYRAPITSFGLALDSIALTLLIAYVSFVLAWDSRKRADFGMTYTQMRFNYVMKFLKIISDDLASIKTTQTNVGQKVDEINLKISSAKVTKEEERN